MTNSICERCADIHWEKECRELPPKEWCEVYFKTKEKYGLYKSTAIN